VRWIGVTTPQHGFDKPQLTISFMFGPERKDSRTLKIGAGTGDGMWCASVDDREGTFVINNPDLNALKLPLVSQATPSPLPPSPSPSVSPVSKP
jgi:hypothetical protein